MGDLHSPFIGHIKADSAPLALYALVSQIPYGRTVSYGALGRALSPRLPALVVGRLMASCPPDLPWWRVTGANGALLIARRSPHMADEQRARLQAEGVHFTNPLTVDPVCDISAALDAAERFSWG